MVDQEPAKYRPRRAFVEADAEPSDGASTPAAPLPPAPTPTPSAAPAAPDDDEVAKPLFRDAAADADTSTVRTPGSSTSAPNTPAPTTSAPTTSSSTSSTPTASTAPSGPDQPRTARPLTFVPRKPAAADEEQATTLLPRVGGHRGVEADDLADDDLAGRHLGRRTKVGLLIAAVAAVVAIGIAIAYAVTGVSNAPTAGKDPSAPTSTGTSTTAPSATQLLTDASMLAPAGAKQISTGRTWTVATTVRGVSEDAPGPACLGTDPLEGAPTPQQRVLRTLTASGANPPAALHVAQAYATAEEASQAYAVTAKALGSCTITGDYLFSGRVVRGAGDEATGSLVHSVEGGDITGHSVLISRTGRVLDIVDASQAKEAPNVDNVAKALAAVVGSQCQAAGGACATSVAVSDGPPPVGDDESAFLTTGDLPPASKNPTPWVATPVEAPAADFTGSQCETVSWSTLAATSKGSRVYLLQDSPGFFGLNDIVVTLKDADTAAKLVEKTRSDWTTCKERKLTATVATPTKVTGVAANGARINGYTTSIDQKAGDSTNRYRVGIAASGNKVAFTFLNPVNGNDLTSDQWNVVAVRAVQRATQAS